MADELRELLAAAIGAKCGHEIGHHRFARRQLVLVADLAATLRPTFDTLALSTDDSDDVDLGDVLALRWPPVEEKKDDPYGEPDDAA